VQIATGIDRKFKNKKMAAISAYHAGRHQIKADESCEAEIARVDRYFVYEHHHN
jgi:hypothetical protein